MKKIVLIIVLILGINTSQAQVLETIGSGVADFLLSNPNTSNNLSIGEQTGLRIIGNLLATTGQRKHEMNVANAGRTQINLQTNSGQQLQLVRDENGTVYAVSNGQVYPISQNIVNKAKELAMEEKDGYLEYARGGDAPSEIVVDKLDKAELERAWNIPAKEYFLLVSGNPNTNIKTVSDLVKVFGVTLEDVFTDKGFLRKSLRVESKKEKIQFSNGIRYIYNAPFNAALYRTNDPSKTIGVLCFSDANSFETKKIQNLINKGRRTYLDNTSHINRIFLKTYIPSTPVVFTAKWMKDFNEDSLIEFSEYQDKRNYFSESESFVIIGLIRGTGVKKVKVKIFSQKDGKPVFERESSTPNEYNINQIITQEINGSVLPPGIYSYSITFIGMNLAYEDREIGTSTGKFQILPSRKNFTKVTQEQIETKAEQKSVGKNQSSNNDATARLFKLLEEGKISEEAFVKSLEALNKK